jgi:hypothetical protein
MIDQTLTEYTLIILFLGIAIGFLLCHTLENHRRQIHERRSLHYKQTHSLRSSEGKRAHTDTQSASAGDESSAEDNYSVPTRRYW